MKTGALAASPVIYDNLWKVQVGEAISLRRGMTIPAKHPGWRLTKGWAAQQTGEMRGTRRIVSLLLPGDFITETSVHCQVVSLTDIQMAQAASIPDPKALHEAARGRLIDHAARLAGYEAYERLADLLLELYARLRAAGLATGRRFPFPIGQHVLGNMLGMSEVHVNRMIARLRADGYLLTGPGWYSLPDPDSLRLRIETERSAA